MKKQYSKPGIVIEEFKIAQNISLACGAPPGGSTLGRPRYADGAYCAWQSGDLNIFIKGNTKCTDVDLDEGEDYFGICYNNPTPNTGGFAAY